MDGGAGNDQLKTGTGSSVILGMAGDDHLTGGPEADLMDGGDGNDVIEGAAGDDVLLGGTGDDRLTGGAGDDYIDGGPGYDTVSGERITPVAYWSLNETIGQTAADSSGTPQDGTYFGERFDLNDPGTFYSLLSNPTAAASHWFSSGKKYP